LAGILILLGYPDRGIRHLEAALQEANDRGLVETIVPALRNVVAMHHRVGDAAAVKQFADRYVALAMELGLRQPEAFGRYLKGRALAMQGDLFGGIAEMQAGLEFHRDSGLGWSEPTMLAYLGEVYGWAGRAEEGLQLVQRALERMQETGMQVGARPDFLRIKGELLLDRTHVPRMRSVAEAEACFLQAIKVAQQQSNRWFGLKATTSWARLLRDEGRVGEARRMLGEAYGWFTEGCGTPIMQQAKALLDELEGMGD
jgi:predicted ATPase